MNWLIIFLALIVPIIALYACLVVASEYDDRMGYDDVAHVLRSDDKRSEEGEHAD